MNSNQIILMADIISSRNKDQKKLMHDFNNLVQLENNNQKKNILSPLTITLGDEFQGIIKSLREAMTIIFELEEGLILSNFSFKLRYVLVEGTIETPINSEIAYGMLGAGLTQARDYLIKLKSTEKRFLIQLRDKEKEKAMNNIFMVIQEIMDKWNLENDYELISNFIRFDHYKIVAEKLKKNPSLMWKRKKSLQINTYKALKEITQYIGGY